MAKATPVILEPIMKVEVETPEEYMGDVMGDLKFRQRRILGMEARIGGFKHNSAEVPLEEMFGYATNLRSMTKGRASYSMEFECYREVPKDVQDNNCWKESKFVINLIKIMLGEYQWQKVFSNVIKPHVNVGTIGHVDHGKTTLTAAITKVSS